MNKMKMILSLGCFCFLFLSCQKDTFKEYSKLEDFRVLALLPDLPEVSPGATVVITPYLSDVANTGPYTFVAKSCFDPGVAYGAKPTCDGGSGVVDIASGAVTGLSATAYTGTVNSFSVAIPAGILALYSNVDQYNGVSYLVTYDVTNSQGKTISSFHRIVVSTRTTKNSNPVIADIMSNGTSLGTTPAASQVDLSVSLATGYQENYDYKKSDGTLVGATETSLITYFYMDGSTKYFRTANPGDVNTYTAPDSYPSGRDSYIVVVVRDGRGGVAADKRKIN